MRPGTDEFSALIAPLSVTGFLADYWERTFLHQQHELDRFSNYFSLRDVDRWLASTPGSLVITSAEGKEGQNATYRPREISASFAYASFARGCSLLMDSMEDWPPLQGLVKAVARELHAEIAVRAYLTPAGAKVLPTHAANSDTFILHLEGEKIWQLHEFSLLQLNPLEKKNFKFPLEWYGRTQSPVLAEVCLKPGNVLFIPRGMPHQAVAQNGACLHLYLSVAPFCWMDFLKVAAECVALHSQSVRRSLLPGFVGNQDVCERMRSTFQEVMRTFQELASFDEVLAAVKRNRVTLQNFPADGHFAELAVPTELTGKSEVERRRDVLCVVDDVVDINRQTKSVIFFGKEHVGCPPRLRHALEFIRDHARFRVSEVPGLDEQGQLVLVRRLIVEGLLRRVTAGKRIDHLEPAVLGEGNAS